MYDTVSTPYSYSSITLSLSSSQTYVVFGIRSLPVDLAVVGIVGHGYSTAVRHNEQRRLVFVIPSRCGASSGGFLHDLLIPVRIKRVRRSASGGGCVAVLIGVVVQVYPKTWMRWDFSTV